MNGQILIWDYVSQQTALVFSTNAATSVSAYAATMGVMRLKQLSDGRLLTFSGGNSLKIWNLNTLNQDLTISTNCYYFDEWINFQKLLCLNGTHLNIWDLYSAQLTNFIEMPNQNQIKVLKNGNVAVADYSGTIYVYEMSTFTQINTLSHHTSGIAALETIGTNYLISSSYDFSLIIWDLNSPSLFTKLTPFENYFANNIKAVSDTSFYVSTYSNMLKYIQLGDPVQMTEIKLSAMSINQLVLSNQNIILVAVNNSALALVDINNGNSIQYESIPSIPVYGIMSMEYLRNDKILFI